jgi:HD-GYP domain-containing protein (c-di-GMP phosphodiesterase class II)
MLEIPLSIFEAGNISDQKYFSEDGNVLIPHGVLISQQFLNNLKQRNIEFVFAADNSSDDDLNSLLSLDLTGNSALSSISPLAAGTKPAPESITELLVRIKPGKEGFIELIKSSTAMELDSALNIGAILDKPTGISLKSKATRMNPGKRSPEYKKSVMVSYENALEKTKNILTEIIECQDMNSEVIRTVVSRFVNMFLTDRDLLINLAGIKSTADDYLYNHSVNVCILSIAIAASFGYNEAQCTEIGMGALLHDVGMLLIPKEIRFKNSKLGEDDLYELQKHPLFGLYILEKVPFIPPAVTQIAYQCHERENGKGYPKQRSSRLIHNYAKIVAIADIFEAISSPRCYREANLPYKSMETIINMTRQGLISGDLVKALLECTSLFPIGSVVELSNKSIGKVVQSNESSYAKPTVCIFTDSNGARLPENKQYIEDLFTNTSIQVVKTHPCNASIDYMQGF